MRLSSPEFRHGLLNFAKHATWILVKDEPIHPGPVYNRVYAAAAPAHMLSIHLEAWGPYPYVLKVQWSNYPLLEIQEKEDGDLLKEILAHATKRSLSLEEGLKHLSHWLYPR